MSTSSFSAFDWQTSPLYSNQAVVSKNSKFWSPFFMSHIFPEFPGLLTSHQDLLLKHTVRRQRHGKEKSRSNSEEKVKNLGGAVLDMDSPHIPFLPVPDPSIDFADSRFVAHSEPVHLPPESVLPAETYPWSPIASRSHPQGAQRSAGGGDSHLAQTEGRLSRPGGTRRHRR